MNRTYTKTYTRFWDYNITDLLQDAYLKASLDMADRREFLPRHIIERMEDKLTVLKCAIESMGEIVNE